MQHDIDALLPLPPVTFHILVALADEDRHGYAIMQDISQRTEGSIKLGAGTLYRSMQRMLEQGLVAEISTRPAPELDDERRRYYRITPFGRTVAKAEARRLAQMLKLARAGMPVTDRGSPARSADFFQASCTRVPIAVSVFPASIRRCLLVAASAAAGPTRSVK